MALRLLLVGMVASLGLDVPTGWRVDSWQCAGRSWFESRQDELQELTETAPLIVDARVDEPPASARSLIVESADESAAKVATRPAPIEVIEEPDLVPVAEPRSTQSTAVAVVVDEPVVATTVTNDDTFAAIVDKIVVSFSAPVEEPSKTTLLAERPLELPQDVFASLPVEAAVVLADAADPVQPTRTAEPPPAPDAAEWIGAATTDAADPSPAQDTTIAPKSATRNERLFAAVRLTRQAFAAWVGVIDQGADIVAVQH
jgi:hypothetical protein